MTVRPAPAAAAAAAVGLDGAPPAVSLWEEWFHAATPAQRAAVLALAQQQGLVYPHQLPAVNGARTPLPAGADSPAAAIATLLSGDSGTLPPLREGALELHDAELDSLQRLAVQRALDTPDVCLIQGLSGSGKSRVVAEIVTQAAQRGWRTLLTAPDVPALDVVLERLAGRSEVLPLRYLESGEAVGKLAPAVRACTLAEQRQALAARLLAGARQSVADAEAARRRRQDEQVCWARLRSLMEKIEAVSERRTTLGKEHESVPAAIQREAEGLPCVSRSLPSGPFAAELMSLRRAHREAVAGLQADEATVAEKRQTRARELKDMDEQIQQLQPLHDARTGKRWWTRAFWAALLYGNVPAVMDGLRARRLQCAAAASEAAAEAARLEDRQQMLQSAHEDECAALFGSETARRRHELCGRIGALERELLELRRQWQDESGAIAEPAERPADVSASALRESEARWQRACSRDERTRQIATQWQGYVESTGMTLAARLPQLANLLVATSACIQRDEALRSAVGAGCDLLIIEDAERVTESELLRLAGLARRVVLVGQAACDELRPAEKETRSLTGLPPLAPACWPRLWQTCGGDLGRLPYAWYREADRLVCQLVPLQPEEQRFLESEGLADAADVELRILHCPRQRPVLAQMVFPAGLSLQEAFTLIVREVGELPLAPLGRTAWWSETAEAWHWCLGPQTVAVDQGVELQPGLRLCWHVDASRQRWFAVRVEFVRAAGWDRTRGEEWVAAHVPGRDLGRSVFLPVAHRFAPGLRRSVAAVLFPERWGGAPATALAPEPRFDFTAVPPLHKPELPREGAGLELDLASPRHLDRLPAELRRGLPASGFVNYLEAQALVRRLEQLAQTPGLLPDGGATVVVALFEAQAELLRRMLAQSDVLRDKAVQPRVCVPGQLRQRECEVVLLSLTRSHAHRSVPFGSDAGDLAIALTRARRQLFVFGDIGALVKRTHWQGPLDHFTAPAAQLEWQRVSRLVGHLQQLNLPRRALNGSKVQA